MKKSSGGKGDGAATTSINLVEVPKIVNPSMLGVTLNIRMVTWKYLNFQIKVRLNSRVFAIEEKIRQHHGGSVHDVFLYNGVVSPENLLNDPSLTLFEAGFEGDIEGSEPEQDVWYDFSPLQSSCPLLMATPNDREQRESPYRSASRMSNRSPSPTGRVPAPASAASTMKRGSVLDLGGASPALTPMSRRDSVAQGSSVGTPLQGSPSIGPTPLSRRPTIDGRSDSPGPASPALKALQAPTKP